MKAKLKAQEDNTTRGEAFEKGEVIGKRQGRKQGRKQIVEQQKLIIEGLNEIIKKNKKDIRKYLPKNKYALLLKAVNDARVKLNSNESVQQEIDKVQKGIEETLSRAKRSTEASKSLKNIAKLTEIKLKKGNKQEGTRTVKEHDTKRAAQAISSLSQRRIDKHLEIVAEELEKAETDAEFEALIQRELELEYGEALKQVDDIAKEYDKLTEAEQEDALADLQELENFFKIRNQEWMEQTKKERVERAKEKAAKISVLLAASNKGVVPNVSNIYGRARHNAKTMTAEEVAEQAIKEYKENGGDNKKIISKIRDAAKTNDKEHLLSIIKKRLKAKVLTTSKDYKGEKTRIFHPMKIFENFDGIIETVFGISGSEALKEVKSFTMDKLHDQRRKWENTNRKIYDAIKKGEKLLDSYDLYRDEKGVVPAFISSMKANEINNRKHVQDKKLGFPMTKKYKTSGDEVVGNIDKMSYMDIAYLASLLKDSETLKLLENTYTDESIEGLINHVNTIVNENEVLSRFVQYQEEVFYPMMYDLINPVYKRMYNVDMPKIEGVYVPRSVVNRAIELMDLSIEDGRSDKFKSLYLSPDSIKNRRSGSQEINLRDDALNKMKNYGRDMANFIEFAELKREFVGLFTNAEVKNAISALSGGRKLNKIIGAFLENMPRKQKEELSVKGLKLLINNTIAVLSNNLSMIPKQLSSAVVWIMNMPTKTKAGKLPLVKEAEFVARLVDPKNFAAFLRDFYGSDFVWTRLTKGFDSDLSIFNDPTFLKMLESGIPYAEKLAKATKFFKENMAMGSIKVGDIGAFLLAAPVYSKVKAMAIERMNNDSKFSDKSVKEINDLAIKEAVDYVATEGEKVQQSQYPENMSYWQLGSASKFFPFMTTKIQYQQQVMKAMRNISRGQGDVDDARRLFVYGFLNKMIFTSITAYIYNLMRGADDDDDEKKEDVEKGELEAVGKILDIGSNIFQGVPIMYEAVQVVASKMKGEDYFDFAASPTIDKSIKTVKSMIKVIDIVYKDGKMVDLDDLTEKDWDTINTTILGFSDFSGVSLRNLQKLHRFVKYGNAYHKKDDKENTSVKRSSSSRTSSGSSSSSSSSSSGGRTGEGRTSGRSQRS